MKKCVIQSCKINTKQKRKHTHTHIQKQQQTTTTNKQTKQQQQQQQQKKKKEEAAYLDFKIITTTRQYLTEAATKTIVTSCILSKFEYYNFLLTSCPHSVIQPLQTVQSSSARLIFRSTRSRRHLSFRNFPGFRLSCASNTKHAVSASK